MKLAIKKFPQNYSDAFSLVAEKPGKDEILRKSTPQEQDEFGTNFPFNLNSD